MKNFLVFFFCSCVLWSENSLEILDRHVQSEVKKGRLVGAAVAVFDQDKITFIKAYGVRKKGYKALVDLDTVFQLGSVSKPITALLVNRLEQEGVISSDDAELRQVLSHTTGYSRRGWNSLIESGWSRESLLRKLDETVPHTPGHYDYHNLAFSRIEDIIERVTHKPFKLVLQQDLLKPFHMNRTTVGFEEFSKQDNRAWPHVKSRRGLKASRDYSNRYHKTVMSAAGVNSSIRDMSSFLTQVMSDRSFESFFEPAVRAPNASTWFRNFRYSDVKSYYGYGWHLVDIDGERMVFHGGWVKGFVNFVAFSPKHKKGIVILSNAETPFGLKTATKFLRENRVN